MRTGSSSKAGQWGPTEPSNPPRTETVENHHTSHRATVANAAELHATIVLARRLDRRARRPAAF